MKAEQEKTPIFEAVKNYYYDKITPFHVPGHKGGNGLPEFKAFVGDRLLGIDLTCMPDLDNIYWSTKHMVPISPSILLYHFQQWKQAPI